ncbi:fms interacting protein [Culex quinquefasciatus]|uniref:Fms interacting protein n=1 Tax=Culex quinquefasciatus TaxID=7176 RepID=B0WE13_CULQU|nr:fms interacting protein [Culex quinquefasciatus]|eukprot:XP_001846947.1 fms interacting protein [Culex quinquefasciatus]
MVNKTDSNDHEPTDKKRRKSTSNTVAFKEQEAAKRSPEAVSKLFHATCDELRKLFDEIVTLKKEEVKIMNQK